MMEEKDIIGDLVHLDIKLYEQICQILREYSERYWRKNGINIKQHANMLQFARLKKNLKEAQELEDWLLTLGVISKGDE